MSGFAAKVALNLRMRSNLRAVLSSRRRQLRQLLASAEPLDTRCPICGSSEIAKFVFVRTPAEGRIEKGFCRKCEHLFTDYLQTDPALASDLFEVGAENEGQPTQVALLLETAERAGLESGTFLDFGVGGNISAFSEAARLRPQDRFMGCDVYASDVDGYFTTYGTDAPLGTFDGISSYAVIEHLTGTLETWRRFNRLLKPMSAGGGWMVHAFPSQLHHDFDHWAIQIRLHTCLFSKESLRLTCKASGFEFVKGKLPRPVGLHSHPVLVFRKIRDL